MRWHWKETHPRSFSSFPHYLTNHTALKGCHPQAEKQVPSSKPWACAKCPESKEMEAQTPGMTKRALDWISLSNVPIDRGSGDQIDPTSGHCQPISRKPTAPTALQAQPSLHLGLHPTPTPLPPPPSLHLGKCTKKCLSPEYTLSQGLAASYFTHALSGHTTQTFTQQQKAN